MGNSGRYNLQGDWQRDGLLFYRWSSGRQHQTGSRKRECLALQKGVRLLSPNSSIVYEDLHTRGSDLKESAP